MTIIREALHAADNEIRHICGKLLRDVDLSPSAAVLDQLAAALAELDKMDEKRERADRILKHWRGRGDTSNFEIAFIEHYMDHFKTLRDENKRLREACEAAVGEITYWKFGTIPKGGYAKDRVYDQLRTALGATP